MFRSIQIETLERKIEELDLEINRLQKDIKQAEENKIKIQYVINEFTKPVSNTNYDSSKGTKDLIVDILREENKKLSWKDVFFIFAEVKPEIKESTFRVSLYQVSGDDKYPVKGANELYWYEV